MVKSFIRPLSKLHLLDKKNLFGVFLAKFFDHMFAYALKIWQEIHPKIFFFLKQSEFRKRSIIFFLFPVLLFSSEFTATVNKNSLSPGESVILTLTLKDASPKGMPNFVPIEQLFSIHSKQQMNQSFFTNGTMSNSLIWKLTLFPKQEGDMIIPSLPLETSQGLLYTQPISLKISKDAGKAESVNSGVSLSAEIKKTAIYKNEPILFTLRLISKYDLSNVSMPQFNIADSILELNGEPKTYRRLVNGEKLNIAEFSYIVTPLKSGMLKIPTIDIQGSMIQPQKSRMQDPYLDDDMEFFSFFRGFDQVSPFKVSSEEIALDVLPPQGDVKPWLPAQSLTIEEIADPLEGFKVGEPFTRSFHISGIGLKANQLPTLENVQIGNQPFKMYADKPELEDEILNGKISSSRKEKYTIIAQQAGSLTLPEIKIDWWNTEKKAKESAILPAKTLQVLPSPEINTPLTSNAASVPLESSQIIIQKEMFPYYLIGLLTLILIGVIAWSILLQRRLIKLTEHPQPIKKKTEKIKKHAIEKKEKLPDLNPT